MRGTANRSAWIWVAIAAITLTALNGAEAGLPGARAGAHPTLERLIRLQNQSAASVAGSARAFVVAKGRRAQSWASSGILGGGISAQPVEFVGLLTPLALFSIAFFWSFGRAPSAPLLCASFQRPPPTA